MNGVSRIASIIYYHTEYNDKHNGSYLTNLKWLSQIKQQVPYLHHLWSQGFSLSPYFFSYSLQFFIVLLCLGMC